MNDTARALIGRTVGGRFKLTSFIGEGAMASVFRGEQIGEPRTVAVKVMHRGLSDDRSFLGRFHREARAAARIDHRNTVRILDHGRDRDVVYIAMELVSGQDLFEVLVRERRLPQARAVRIVLQICAALEAAHRRGVVHRDLKPENVMLVHDPDHPGAELVKVLDFGIAKLLERERVREPKDGEDGEGNNPLHVRADSVITLVGTVIGTPEYMSPEQARGVPPVDARSDVYAVGVLLYQLVTGKLPFRGESPIEVILQHIERKPTPPRALVPDLHPGVESIILTALAKWPAERQQSAQQLADDLAAILPALESAPPSAAQPTAAPSSDLDDAPPTVRMLPGEVCFPDPPESLETIPTLLVSPPGALRGPDVPSPWAMGPQPLVHETSARTAIAAWLQNGGAFMVGFWLMFVAMLAAAIWLGSKPP